MVPSLKTLRWLACAALLGCGRPQLVGDYSPGLLLPANPPGGGQVPVSTDAGVVWKLPNGQLGWTKVVDCDLMNSGSQTLTTNGTYTFCTDTLGHSITWTKQNSAQDRVAMALTSGTGLVVNATASAAYTGVSRTLPLVTVSLATVTTNFGASIDWATQYRMTVWVTATSAADNQDQAIFGVDVGSSNWAQFVHWGLGPGAVADISLDTFVAGSEQATGNAAMGGLGAGVQSVTLELTDVLKAYANALTGTAYDAGWPLYASMQPQTAHDSNIVTTNGDFNLGSPPAPGSLSVFLGAFNGGDNPTLTYKHVRLDVR